MVRHILGVERAIALSYVTFVFVLVVGVHVQV